LKKPRKRGENEFFPNVKGRISRGSGRHLWRGGEAMVGFLDDYGVFHGEFFPMASFY
jgi:hypothetical protein